MNLTPCDAVRALVTTGRRNVATMIGVLTLLVLIGPFTAICFGGDGHVAIELLPTVHHSTAESGASGSHRAAAGTISGNGHGPCVDVFLETVHAPDSQVRGVPAEWVRLAAEQAGPAALPGWQIVAVSIRGAVLPRTPLIVSLPVRSLRTTLLRI